MTTASTRGYKVKLDGGVTLIAEISERGWTVKVTGDGWKPGIHASAPIWEDNKKWEAVPNTLGIDAVAWNEFRASVEQQEAEAAKAKPEAPVIEDTPESIKKVATRIAEKGKPLKFMLDTFNRTHKGDRLHGESQLIGFGLQSAYNTLGVFGTWDGPSGKGKSDGAKACVRQLPPEYVITSSITAKSLYHRAKEGGMLPGSVLYLDDKNVEAGSDLEETLKRIQTFFQEGAEHETLDGKGGYIRTKLPPRLLVVRTYVDSNDTDTQLKNRTMGFGVDSSRETDRAVCDLVLKLAEEGQTTDVITKQTLICQELWRDIKSQVYRVRHPAASQLIEFSDVSNRRNPGLFMDLVTGLACIRHRQRITEEGPNGETILYANFEDYLDAARLFNSQGDYLGTRLDKAEFEAVQYIKDQGPEGATLNGIFYHLSGKFPADGWNTQKVRRLMDGRPEREIKGLADTIPGIEPRWMTTDNNNGKYKVYSIPGDLPLGVRVTVHDPRSKPISGSDFSHLSHRFPTLGKDENDINIPLSHPSYPKYPIKEKEGENNREESTPLSQGKNNSFSRKEDFGKSGKTRNENEPLDTGNRLFPYGKSPGKPGKTRDDPHLRREENPGLETFKAGMARRQCCLCGQTSPYDLTPYYNNGQSGYICSNCHIYGPPSEPTRENGSQTRLEEAL